MSTVTRPGTLEQLLVALTDTPGVHVLAGKSADYWSTVVAWQPVAALDLEFGHADWSNRLRAFTQDHAGQQCIGYLSYSAADLPLPDVHIAAFTEYVSVSGDNLIIHYENEAFVAAVDKLLEQPANRSGRATYDAPFTPSITKANYEAAFEACQEYIKAGDIYQINLTHQLRGQSSLSGMELFLRLYEASTPGQLAFIGMDSVDVISGSPERFIRVQDGVITTQPIKGTRPRGTTPEADAHLRQELIDSPKEQAELAMITDLLRNDLGKVCRVGSVELREARVITEHASIWHSHSTIVGELSEHIAPIDALISMSPGGSITGCPKKRAMEVIAELEAAPRGLYTGTIFSIAPNGSLDSSIVIRTVFKHGTDLYLSVGGGIVYDSVQKDEYIESLNKGKLWMSL